MRCRVCRVQVYFVAVADHHAKDVVGFGWGWLCIGVRG